MVWSAEVNGDWLCQVKRVQAATPPDFVRTLA
jgi:hypothetical protein